MSLSTDDWQEVVVKPPRKHQTNREPKPSIDNDKLIEQIKVVLVKYAPLAIFMYGSRARNTPRPNSDVDLMIFWKSITPSIEELREIKAELVDAIKINVDFVAMCFTQKIVNVTDLRTICYYENVQIDAKCIYSSKKVFLDELILYSKKLPKI